MLMQAEAAAAPLGPVVQRASDGIEHVFCLVGVMLAAGTLGGVINYYQAIGSSPEQPKESSATPFKPRMPHRVVIGIGAAFLVPLFLNMISSDLLLACKETPTKLLVFAGFCLVASISSSAFIRSLSDRLLEQAARSAEEANRGVEEVKTDLEPIKAKATEPDAGASSGSRQVLPANEVPGLGVGQRVLRALCETEFAFRSVEGISRSTGIARKELEVILNSLAQDGLVRDTPTEDGLRWCITKKGRKLEASGRISHNTVRLRRYLVSSLRNFEGRLPWLEPRSRQLA
jgi:hypothetical protein